MNMLMTISPQSGGVSLNMFSIVAGLAAVLIFILWYRSRKRRIEGKSGPFMPHRAPRPDWTSRVAEALILAAAGLVVLLLTATKSNTGGLLLMLDELRPEFARVNVIIFLCAAGGLLAAVLMSLFLRTWAAVLIMAAVLSTYGWILNGPGDLKRRLDPGDALRPTARFVISLTDDVVGADLWVNGVYLGKTPIVTTMDKFLAKVPYWSEPPKGYRDKTDEVRLPDYDIYGGGTSIKQRWIRFELPHYVESHGPGGRPKRKESRNEFYARVRLGDAWGCGYGGSGSATGGRHSQRCQTRLKVIFPQHQRRFEKLLDKARLQDYEVSQGWFRAAETHGKPGWKALRAAAVKDPSLMKVFDAWARHRCRLDQAVDTASAWGALERVCDEADAAGEYRTDSIAGRATELLVPRLDPEKLVGHAEKLIRRYHGWSGTVSYASRYGRGQFSVTRPLGFSGKMIPPSAAAIAHAVWMLDKQLDAAEQGGPNLVEARITPALICWKPFWNHLMAACVLGGPEIHRYLERHPWRAHGTGDPHGRDTLFHFGGKVNQWAYLLANLSGHWGRKFRTDRRREMTQLADEMFGERFHDEVPEFIFLETLGGREGFAETYWPKFKAIAAGKKYHALKLQWKYLAKMEPFTTIDMYRDAWREFTWDYGWRQEALSELDVLPPTKRQSVIDALLEEVRDRPLLTDGWSGTVQGWQEYLIRELQRHASDAYIAGEVLRELREGAEERRRQQIGLWLEHTRPDHPLVKMLAEGKTPAARLLVMGAMKAHPTPANRVILHRLLADDDLTVRTAAEEVQRELDSLAADDAMKYASQGPGRRRPGRGKP